MYSIVQMGPLPRAGSEPKCLKTHGRLNPTNAESVPPLSTASPTAKDNIPRNLCNRLPAWSKLLLSGHSIAR